MKQIEKWTPSKYVPKNGRLVAARDQREVGISSRLIADIVADLYLTHIKDHCRGRLLDLGCGKVPLFDVYRGLIKENICVDWANSTHGNKHLDFECDLTRPLPFPDASFDTVIMSDVLEHIPEPLMTWREMSRILVPGGKILLNVPFYYWLHEHPHDYYRYTEFALRRFADLAGFDVVILKPIGGVPEILADIVAKNMTRLGRMGRYGSMLTQHICGLFIRTRPGRKFSESTAKNFPFGYFMIARKVAQSGPVGTDHPQ